MASIFTKIVLTAAITATTASPLMAQNTLHALKGYDRNENRAMLSLAVPFGGQREEAKPRVELIIQNRNVQSGTVSSTFVSNFDRVSRENRIGFTLDNEPTLMLNGRKFESVGGRRHINTGAGIAIGLGLVAGVLLFATLETADEISDLVEPD